MTDDVGLTEAEREAVVCDCAVALATDACPVHADDDSLWSEQPASHILAAMERIVADRVRKAEQRGAVQMAAAVEGVITGWDDMRARNAMGPSGHADEVRVAMSDLLARAERLAGGN